MKRIYMRHLSGLTVLFYIALLCLPLSIQAAEGLRLPQTRVIFTEGEKSTTAGIQNLSDKLYLVKAEVLNSTDQNKQDKNSVPFLVIPPLFRLEPQSQYRVRILSQGTTNLPDDRESVFYLSFLAIPSTTPSGKSDESAVTAQVSVGIQTLIKLFYRPTKLAMTAHEAQNKLVFQTYKDTVVMENPTPYYLTLNTLNLKGKNIELEKLGAMIAPFSKKTYHVNGKSEEAKYTVINDYGAVSKTYLQSISSMKEIP
ncbi:molecular chaperone [Klebsiella sp. BIGb0407]|uniref:fimbrial biogenesis chaperone n=1 Tax=Klebsiella sp. BIGb0407 TaxID=2940603 RepID=UPI002167B730|nr:molecular chaperone [Klebsiella sp. BIGb0407]MCS3432159.1 P pilus assembly chaperone PapD [Klebsiella sp. BIGb0407]